MRADRIPMEIRLSQDPWQNLPEMARDLGAELAGIETALALLTVWHMHSASRHADAKRTTLAVARCREGLAADERRRMWVERLQ